MNYQHLWKFGVALLCLLATTGQGREAWAVGCTHDDDCDDTIHCTDTHCDLEHGVCVVELNHARCSNNIYCDGEEVCDPENGNHLGCRPGEAVTCDDGLSCTDDVCSNPQQTCIFTPVHDLCDDGLVCNGLEFCDPEDPSHDADGCMPGEDVQCLDAFTCTVDICTEEAQGCDYQPAHELCDDGNPCTGPDLCTADYAHLPSGCDRPVLQNGTPCETDTLSGICLDGVCQDACLQDTDCDDLRTCTEDRCLDNQCVNTPRHNVCDDEVFCNGGETCDPNAPGTDPLTGCVPGEDVVCDDGKSCTDNLCDNVTSACSFPPIHTRCDDGLFCTGEETCDPDEPGADPLTGCVPGEDVVCDDGVDCTLDTCRSDIADCDYDPDDSACDDGDPCTINTCDGQDGCRTAVLEDGASCGTGLVCLEGLCVVSCTDHTDCDDGRSCTLGHCDPETHTCTHMPSDTLCDDGNVCTGQAVCDPEAPGADPESGCVAGTPLDCADGNPCTGESCDSLMGCTYPPLPDGTLCDIEPVIPEICVEGHCLPKCSTDLDCDDGLECTQDTCDFGSGLCLNTPSNLYCNDFQVCNGTETCDPTHPDADLLTGCLNGTPLTCHDAYTCTQDRCSNAAGGCVYDPIHANCSDHNVCTGSETCAPGAPGADPETGCLAGTSLICEDDDPCKDSQCDPETGCFFVPKSDGASCDVNPSIPEICVEGQCVRYCASDADCSDGIVCTQDVCNLVTHTCAHTPQDLACDDDNVCNGAETCAPASPGAHLETGCLAGTNLVCNDGRTCTVDTCHPETGCINTPDHTVCDNDLYCDGEETCNPTNPAASPTTGCLAGTSVNCDDGRTCTLTYCDNPSRSCVVVTRDDFCDDGNVCNGEETCAPQDPNASPSSGCLAGSQPNCDDHNACTVDACDPDLNACTSTPDDTLCDNHVFCDGPETCHPQQGCLPGVAPDCDDGVACTVDSCHEGDRACRNIPNHAVCQNDSFCDGQEVCDPEDGCQPGTPPTCEDGIACTVTYCDEVSGRCEAEPNHDACDNGLFCDGEEVCVIGLGCVEGTPPDCRDAVSCTHDTCDTQTDSCLNSPDDALCDNGAFCDGQEWCHPTLDCRPGAAVPCQDAVSCTVDACNNDLEDCVYTPDDSLCPPPGDCRDLVACDPTEGCLYENHPDNNVCVTLGGGPGVCRGGLCVSGCTSDAHCNDGIVCTADACGQDNVCVHTPMNLFCDNTIFCDGEEICVAGLGCVSGPPRSCNDGFACTLDHCDEPNKHCVNQARHDFCADDVWCNGDELCAPANPDADVLGCAPAASPRCDDGFSCTLDLCDEETRDCSASPNHAACDDAVFCNGEEVCDPDDENADEDGCHAGMAPDCDDGFACTLNTCDPILDRCVNTADDTRCDDDRYCSGQERCIPDDPGADDRGCVEGTNPCDDGYLCTLNLCDEGSAACDNSPLHSLCDDDLFCNGEETCDPTNPSANINGCLVGTAPCDDGVSCTIDQCDEGAASCIHTPDHASCDDANFCNGTETCDPLLGCLSGPQPSCDDNVPCTQDRCDPQLNRCVHDPDDSACDDEAFCNGPEVCDPVQGCLPGTPPSCEDGFACTSNVCNPETDACEALPDDSLCDDDIFCNGPETCVIGQGCTPGATPACDDEVDCTLDTCDLETDGCRHVPLDSRCDDTVFCNGPETCDPVQGCLPGTSPDCNDGVDCTIDFCDLEQDVCIHDLDHNLCDDGEFCTGDEFCSLEGCYTIDRVCDDTVACTVDRCDDEEALCESAPDDAFCDDGNPCTGPGTCDPMTGCQNTPIPDGTACSLSADRDESCQGGFCVPECEADADCEDGIPCTRGVCGERGHCQFEPDDDICNAQRPFCDPIQSCVIGLGCVEGDPPDCGDGVACTLDTCSTETQACVRTPDHDACNDHNPCTRDTCDPRRDCVYTILDDGTPCGTDYVCRDGECVPPVVDGDIDGDTDGDTDGDIDTDFGEEPSDVDPDVPDGDLPDGDSPDGDESPGGGKGGCAQTSATSAGWLMLLLALIALWGRRRPA